MERKLTKKIILTSLVFIPFILFAFACSNKEDNSSSDNADSFAQQVGSSMADFDESGGTTGSYASLQSEKKMMAHLTPKTWLNDNFLHFHSSAEATSCTNTFGTCTSNEVVRDFNDCSLNGYTFTGTVTLQFNQSNCLAANDNDTITRIPDFSISGSRGITYTVTKTGSIGQRLTRSGTNFAFSNDGIRRVLTFNSRTLSDFTTTTTSNITISGVNRSGRTANGGVLHVVNNLTSDSCDFTPNTITWNSTCTCPVSGSWSATCSDGKSGTITIDSCTEGTLTLDGSNEPVTFERCQSL